MAMQWRLASETFKTLLSRLRTLDLLFTKEDVVPTLAISYRNERSSRDEGTSDNASGLRLLQGYSMKAALDIKSFKALTAYKI